MSSFKIREVFIRELISNANDAVEKFRLTALTNQDLWNGDPLNITIKVEKEEDGKGGRLIITGESFHKLIPNIHLLPTCRYRHWDVSR